MTKSIRTDLAMEAREVLQEASQIAAEIDGVEAREYERYHCPVTHVRILDERGERSLDKPKGSYITIELRGLARHEPESFSHAVRAVAEEIDGLMPQGGQYTVLLAGLGNRDITPDAIGPLALQSVMVTRHLVDKLPGQFGHMRPVAAVTPGVLGTTGLESAELLKGVVDKLRPSLVMIIDALTARKLDRLCATVQIADTGIVPGSGVGNARAAINKETLGVPVIALGVPTVVDAVTLMADISERAGQTVVDWDDIEKYSGGLMVTPKEIDTHVQDIARVVGYALNLALHPGITVEDVTNFLS